MEEILERQLLIRGQVFAKIEKALVGRKRSESCAAQLCSHTFSGGFNPVTSMALM